MLQLSQARRVFLQHARGPACDKYLDQLEAECSKIWKNGRQLCEVVSLTGKHCINPVCSCFLYGITENIINII